MMNKKPNHFLFENLTDEDFKKAFEIADMRLINLSLRDSFVLDHQETESDIEKLHLVLELLELYIIDLHSHLKTKADFVEFYSRCQEVFILLRSLHFPENDIDIIKYTYKLISYAYLGQNWESGRRFLLENFDKLDLPINDNESWDIRIFKKTFKAFLYLIIKRNWDDLNNVCEYISELRKEQSDFEKDYLSEIETRITKARSIELISLYHLAKATDLAAQFMLKGNTNTIKELLSKHFGEAIKYSELNSNFEMTLLLKLLQEMFDQMVNNSIWWATRGINSRISKFVNVTVNSKHPIYELLYPQRRALVEEGLLNPAHKAIVVNMPTSSGKTAIAEFRILQALNQFADLGGWVVYVAPTRALVNQIYTKLKRDFDPIGIKIEKLSGALDLDIYEENLIEKETKERLFDVLVATPEKLNFLIRKIAGTDLCQNLILSVIDEAHNLEDPDRGLNYEVLMANLSNDCPKINFLLLTPFIENSYEIAKWLDNDNPKSIEVGINWKPNDRIIGAYYAEGNRRDWVTKFDTFITSHERIQIEKEILINNDCEEKDVPVSEIKNHKINLTSYVVKQLKALENILVVCKTPDDCWKLAKILKSHYPSINQNDPDIQLVKRFISAELGENFVLNKLINRGIGVHHAGLSDEIRFLMEWLMENEKLKILVATTTIAQGINFPVSAILMASHSYPGTKTMPIKDFLNLIGRAGRTDHGTLGLVGISVNKSNETQYNDLKAFVNSTAAHLTSILLQLLREIESQEDFKFDSNLYYRNPLLFRKWSEFLQYITHMYNQISDTNTFNSQVDIILRKTLGFNQSSTTQKRILIDSVKKYAARLDENKGLSKLSDDTGFSFESIKNNINKLKKLKIEKEEWNHSNLFKENSKFKNLIGVMLNIPEIRSNLIDRGQNPEKQGETLANIITDWVNGAEIDYLAKKYFKQEGKSISDEELITECYKKLNKNITFAATWGLSSLQKLSGIDFDSLSEEEKAEFRNTSAMIYYGVNTNEAVLMRKNNVPRSLSSELGQKFKQDYDGSIFESRPGDVNNWLNTLKSTDWDLVNKKPEVIKGEDYQKVWKILNHGSVED